MQLDLLDDIAGAEGVSCSVIMREALDFYARNYSASHPDFIPEKLLLGTQMELNETVEKLRATFGESILGKLELPKPSPEAQDLS